MVEISLEIYYNIFIVVLQGSSKNMVKINDIYTVEITDTNIFGNGICHIDGFVVFVCGALAGERCEIKITDARKNFAYAEVISFISKSKERVVPTCPVYSMCGGCSLLHTSIEKENEIKENYLNSIFKKNGIDMNIEKITTPVYEKYRNKVVFYYKNGKHGYMANGTNDVVLHSKCTLNEDAFDEIATLTGNHFGDKIRALYIRKSSELNEIMVCPVLREGVDMLGYVSTLVLEYPSVKTVLCSVYKEKDFALEKAKFKVVYGDGYITDTLCGLSFRISPSSFYQVNPICAEKLYEKAIELASLSENDTCADLFCGTGTIGIICAKKTGATVYGVEINEDAIKDAKFNAKLNGIKNVSFEATDAKNFNKSVDVAIIDPPRKGCMPIMLETLLRLKPKRIVYVSCNAETLARDLKTLLNEYQIASPLYPYNMFPRTSHVESVICLTQK